MSVVVLIVSEKPDWRPLAFAKSSSDALDTVIKKIASIEENLRGRIERAEQKGGQVPSTEGLERWSSARWIEIDLDKTQSFRSLAQPS